MMRSAAAMRRGGLLHNYRSAVAVGRGESVARFAKTATAATATASRENKEHGHFSPAVAWRIAAFQIDPRQLTATGPKGHVLKADVLRFLAAKCAQPRLSSGPLGRPRDRADDRPENQEEKPVETKMAMLVEMDQLPAVNRFLQSTVGLAAKTQLDDTALATSRLQLSHRPWQLSFVIRALMASIVSASQLHSCDPVVFRYQDATATVRIADVATLNQVCDRLETSLLVRSALDAPMRMAIGDRWMIEIAEQKVADQNGSNNDRSGPHQPASILRVEAMTLAARDGAKGIATAFEAFGGIMADPFRLLLY